MRKLFIFLKYPTPGQVKTRLAASVGDEQAATIYRVCTELTLERLEIFREVTTLYVDPPNALDQMRGWLGSEWLLRPQQGSTLGERLIYAIGEAFAQGAQRVVVIGTDSPWLKPEDIEAAFAALEQSDVVLGPTEDGGYYLIGLSRPIPALFEGIAWSTASVYEQTLARTHALDLHVHSLALGYDIDRVEDVRRFVMEEAAQGCVSMSLKAIERSMGEEIHA